MSLSDLSIKNPVFAVMLSTAMVVFGYLGYRDLGISQFPELDFPVVSITTNREAADPETMDFDVTDIIEDAISGVEGIDYIQSQSLEGQSVVTVFFRLSRNVDVAMQDVQNAVSAAAANLPTDIDPPIISKVNFNKFPVMWLSIHGNAKLEHLNKFVDDHLKQQVQTIPGVGGVMYGGLRPRNMRIWLKQDRLQAYQLDAYDVWRAMRTQHVEMPAGTLESSRREMNVRTMGEARTAEEFRRVPIEQRAGGLIRLGDVAVVEDGLFDRRTFARFNRQPNVGVGVMRATGANVVEVCGEIKNRLPGLRKMCPPGIEIDISTDYSLFIQEDIYEVKNAMLMGILLTAIVTFIFLGSIGTTLNVCVSIPTSLMGTFIALRWFGFTVNFMTLLALSLAVGVVVDDAILVLENIYRRREHGEARRAAAVFGSREITFAAIAATFSIVAIFVPIAFMKGAIGRFFFQFGITVTVAVLLSLVVALTITPMLSSLFLNVRQMRRPCPKAHGGLFGPVVTLFARALWVVDRWLLEPVLVRPVDTFMRALSRWYGYLLRQILKVQFLALTFGIGLAALALVFVLGVTVPLPGPVAKVVGKKQIAVKAIGRELVPSEDQNRFVCNVICPVGSNIDYVDEMLRKGEKVMKDMKDPVTKKDVIAGFFASTSIRPGSLITEGILFVRLIPADERTWTQTDVMNEMRVRLMGGVGKYPASAGDEYFDELIHSGGKALPARPGEPTRRVAWRGTAGMRLIVLDLSTQGFTPTRGYPVDFAVQGPDWEIVTKFSERIKEAMIDSGAIADVNSDYRPGQPEVQIVPNKLKAAELGVSIRRVAFAINVAVGGLRDGRFSDKDRRYDVRMRYLEGDRSSPNHVPDLYVRSETSGKLVPLSDVCEVKVVSTLPIINRYNHLRKVEITGNMAPGVSQGEAVSRAREIAERVREEMGLPANYRIVRLGNAQAMAETIESMWWCLTLGFVIAYMILGVQFNSFVHPFTVLMAVPFGVTGALATLYFLGNTLNMMSMIGMILLAGLVKKNSIILIDYTNQLRRQGLGVYEAVLTAGPVRLRPILMTSIATVVGAFPLAFGVGAGAETRGPLAQSIIGGSILATSVTLLIVPVFYVLFERAGAWLRRAAARPGDGAAEVGAVPYPPPSRNGANGTARPPVPRPVVAD